MKTGPSIFKYAPIIAGMMGAVVFVTIWGIKVLDFTYDAWLFNGEDLTQSYFGWLFFKNDSWYFPFGATNAISYPNMTSIIYTDSIPLFAVLFKLISPLLPESFQYLGLFGILCFILQGWFAAKIIGEFTKNLLTVLLGSFLLIYAPILVFRMYIHTALSAHWLLLLCMYLCVHKDKMSHGRAIVAWGIVGALSVSIHMYFTPMCGIAVLVFAALLLLEDRIKWKSLLPIASFLLSAMGMFGLLGGFSSGVSAGGDGLGLYSFNLNAFANPQGWSARLRDLPFSAGQGEGFAYLGLGLLLLIPLTAFNVLEKRNRSISKRTVIFMVALLILFFIALSPRVSLNLRSFTYPLPTFIKDIWSMFRATGRFIWPVFYSLVLFGLCGDLKLVKSSSKLIVLALICIMQVVDLHAAFTVKGSAIENPGHDYVMNESIWQEVAQIEGLEHAVLSENISSTDAYYEIGRWCIDSGLTLNRFYYSRSNAAAIEQAYTASMKNLSADNVYLFSLDSQEDVSRAAQQDGLYYYLSNHYIIGLCQPLEGMGTQLLEVDIRRDVPTPSN